MPNLNNAVEASAMSASGTMQFPGASISKCTGLYCKFGSFTVGVGSTITLDDTMDWRDRLVDVRLASSSSMGTPGLDTTPGQANDMFITPAVTDGNLNTPAFPHESPISASGLWYTGLGYDGAAAAPNYYFTPIFFRTTNVAKDAFIHDLRIYADSATGVLKAKNSVGVAYEFTIMCYATPKLGKRSTVQ